MMVRLVLYLYIYSVFGIIYRVDLIYFVYNRKIYILYMLEKTNMEIFQLYIEK